MGWSELEIKNDPLEGELLVAGGETRKGGAWIARITGTDPTYRYAREFLGTKRYIGKHDVEVSVPLDELQDGDLLDIRTGGSWKNAYRSYYVYENKDVKSISEAELRERLAKKLAAKEAEVNG